MPFISQEHLSSLFSLCDNPPSHTVAFLPYSPLPSSSVTLPFHLLSLLFPHSCSTSSKTPLPRPVPSISVSTSSSSPLCSRTLSSHPLDPSCPTSLTLSSGTSVSSSSFLFSPLILSYLLVSLVLSFIFPIFLDNLSSFYFTFLLSPVLPLFIVLFSCFLNLPRFLLYLLCFSSIHNVYVYL